MPPYGLLSTTLYTGPDDLDGKKVRLWGKYMPKKLGKFGAVAVSVSSAEQYEALAKGTVDLSCACIAHITTYSLWEVAEYFLEGQYLPRVGLYTH